MVHKTKVAVCPYVQNTQRKASTV